MTLYVKNLALEDTKHRALEHYITQTVKQLTQKRTYRLF